MTSFISKDAVDLEIQTQSTIRAKLYKSIGYKCAGALLCLFTLSPLATQAASKDDLKGVSTEITRHSSSINTQKKKLNSLQSDLKKYETSIANIDGEIRGTQSKLETVKANLNNLHAQKKELEAQRADQVETLETLIQTFYLTSRPQEISKIFQSGKAADLDRMSQYYQHLAEARTQALEELEKTQVQIDSKERELSNQQKEQANLLAKQQRKQKELQGAQSERKKTLSSMKQSIQSDEVKLAELKKNEARLKAEIAAAAKRAAEARRKAELKRKQELARRKAEEERRRKAAEAAKKAGQAPPKEVPIEDTAPVSLVRGPMNGLASKKGRLPWPLKGTVLHNYGSTQSGQITWKGLVIAANAGMNVRAVAPGEVVFADWLRGYGLVILIDHGRGDMTLYGYNQSLLKKEGDRVAGGEAIAKAGNTGGQDRNSLYFEIRRNSRAQNPRSWLSR